MDHATNKRQLWLLALLCGSLGCGGGTGGLQGGVGGTGGAIDAASGGVAGGSAGNAAGGGPGTGGMGMGGAGTGGTGIGGMASGGTVGADADTSDALGSDGLATAVSEGGPTAGFEVDPGVCTSPLVFPAEGQATICHGVVMQTQSISFDPWDARWADLYQACLAGYGSLFRPKECDRLCALVAKASIDMFWVKGFGECNLDCSLLDRPVLTVEYTVIGCDP